MAQIFISYSRADEQFIEELIPLLERVYRHHEIWYDKDLSGGELWWEEIIKQIGKSNVFIYLLSNDALTSDYCQAEFREALRIGIPCLPVMIRPKTKVANAPVDLQAEIEKRHWVGMERGFKDAVANAQLYAAINEQLSKSAQQTPVVPSSEQPTAKPESTTRTRRKETWTSNQFFLGILTVMGAILAAVITIIPPMLDRADSAATQAAANTTATQEQSFRALSMLQTSTAVAFVPTPTPSSTETPVPTDTPTNTPTETPVPTDTPTNTPTETPVPTDTPTNTPTETPVPTDTPTNTPTETPVPTDTPTNTPTETPVPTDTPTNTPTETPLPTEVVLSPEEIALTPVTRNEDWVATERDFDGVAMVLVPTGCFMMGHNDGDNDEIPVHEQCFDIPFWIDKYEVTNAQFTRFAGHAASKSRWLEDDRPRENITWDEAQQFCALRRARLPSEAEWEYAARGPNNLIYPWGNEFLSDATVSNKNSNAQTSAVGSRPSGASWVEAFDMSGNVWEWTVSYYGSYPFNGGKTPSDIGRVYRGGGYSNDAYYVRAALRAANTPDFRYPYLGFRCAR